MDLLDEEIEKEQAEAASTSRQSNHHDNDSDFMHREATEIEILMNHRVRISRTRRMNWYLDFHDCYVRLQGPDATGKKPFQIGGVVTKDGDKLEENEEFKVGPTTACLFFSKYYKMSFILDFSPTVFTADSVGDILYTNLMPCVEKMLKELVFPFKFSNSKNFHKAEIYVTLIAYSPFIHFRKPPILVHGFRVTDSTLQAFLGLAQKNAKAYLADLLEYMRPINLKKEKIQMKISKQIGETRRLFCGRPSASEVAGYEEEEKFENPHINDKVAIDFRLIQMLRLGMMGLFSAPETSQPGIVIITDGILYIPNQDVIHTIALTLRTNCIPIHFIEITAFGCSASPGYIPSTDLLSFISKCSYGNHIKHKDLLSYKTPDEFINKFQRIMLSWSCQRGTYVMEDPASHCIDDPGRIRKQISRIKSNFYQLFHVRIREGYFLKSLSVVKKGSKDYISAILTFPWTFDCRIDYQISAIYDDCDERIQDVHRLVTIETNYVPKEPITDPRDSALTAALYLSESEKFVIKILGFSSISDYYEIERIPFHRYPSLYAFTEETFPFPTLIIKQLEKTKYNAFWEPLVLADNAALHRCSHTLSMRFTTNFEENQTPFTNFWPNWDPEKGIISLSPTDFPGRNYLLNLLFEYFKATTTFCLVARYCYVKIVREGIKAPEYCYMIKVFADSTLLTIKVIFVGDCSLDVRNKTVGKIRNDLMNYKKLNTMLYPMAIGVDAKMIKYHQLPYHSSEELYQLQPIEMPESSEIWSTRQKLHQNSLIQIMRPRRIIYKMEKEFDDLKFGEIAIEGMNCIVRKRILEGFKVAFVENGIVHMVKEIASEFNGIPPRVEQFIIFPPHRIPITLRGPSVQQLREQLAAVGKVLQIQKPVGEEDDEEGEEEEKQQQQQQQQQEIKDGAAVSPNNTAVAAEQENNIITNNNPEIEIDFVDKENSPEKSAAAATTEDEIPQPHHPEIIDDAIPFPEDKATEAGTSEATSDKGTTETKKGKKKRKRGKKKSKETTTKKEEKKISEKEGEEGGEKAKEESEEEPPEEVYDDSGCFIVSEYWMEPTTYTKYEAENPERLQHAIEDRAMLSALMTFRSMQAELDRAPGIGTALIGNEAYSMHVEECAPVNIAKNINYHAHLYSMIKMLRCGERLLVLLPTMKYVHTDPHSINRLGRILDSFNHEMKNYMPQCFDFEDSNGAWQALASGLEEVLEEVDHNELIEAEQFSLKDYDTDVERVMDDTEDSTGSGTGYSTPVFSGPISFPSPGSLSPASAPAFLNPNESCASITSQMAKMDDETLRKHILGSYNKRGIFGSGESLNVPKSPSEQRSTSVPLPQEKDDEDQAEFLPSKGKKLSPSIQPPAASAPALLAPRPLVYASDSEREKEAASTKSEKEPKPKKIKKRKKKQSNFHASTMSLTSFDRTSERSRRRAREDAANDQAPMAFYVYYKRRDPKTIIVVMVPATCRAVLKITNKLVPRLPILSFMIEEEKMFEIFHHSMSLPTEFKKTNVENFCVRSALAHLNWQVNAKLSESERETPSPATLFPFETQEGIDPTFTDLNDFCVNIMHDLVFSRAYAQAAYHCLGTNVHVPQTVLEEVLQEHCTQTSVTFGSIRDVLQVTCTHLSSYLQSKRVSRYKRHQMPNISSLSSSSSSSESEIEVQQVNSEYQMMNPFCYSEAENDEICKMEQTEFRLAFENVLRQHKFFKVPAFADYYFYWPNGENTVQLFNSGGTWNEHLDDGTTNNSSSKNNDDETSEDSAVTLVSHDGGSSGEPELDFDIQPLFLQFYVSVPRADGDIYSYAVDFIPNCLQDVIGRCDTNFFTADEKKTLNEFNVEVEMFVLTVPSVESIEKPDERLRRTTEETIDWMLNSQPTPIEDINLPPRERDIVFELKKGINHMLKTEQILILSRYFDTQKSYKNICHVADFVEAEAARNDEHTRVQTAQSDMLFVTKQEEGLRRLCEKLEGAIVDYCKIRCVRDEKNISGLMMHRPIVFYCCSVEDFETFCMEHKGTADLVKFDFKPKKKQRVVTSEGCEDSEEDTTEDATETSTLINQDDEVGERVMEEDESLGDDEVFDYNVALKDSTNNLDEKVKRKQIVHDFWLIAKVESDPVRIRSFFFQRPNGVHNGLFKKFTDLLMEQIKVVNQALLLEELHETKECSPYLIDDEKGSSSSAAATPSITTTTTTAAINLTPSKEMTPLSEFASKFVIQPKLEPNEENDDVISLAGSSTAMLSQDSDTEIEPVTYKYSPGYFFCPLVWRRWYSINPRLRQSTLDLGLRSLRSGLENITIRNRKNIYVFKESSGNIFYMYLFGSKESVDKVISDTSEEWQQELSSNIQNNVLFAVFGIHPPSEEVTIQYANILQKKLDLTLLDELQKSILKNPQLRLRQTDINFIQPKPSQPASTLIYSLPAISKDYLASIFTYLQQHLSSYYIKPQFSDDPMAEKKSDQINFKPYPFDGEDEALAPEYEGVMFLINKPKAEGQRSTGLGCFEMRLVDRKGRLAKRDGGFPSGKLNANSFSLLYPGFSGNEMLQKTARCHELTKCVQIDSFDQQGSSMNSNHFMEFFIWQIGDIGLAELQTRLRIFCLQALADLIVEFGLMAQNFMEPISPLPQISPALISRPSSLMRQSAIDQKAHLRKRGSSTIPEVHFGHPLTPVNLPVPSSPGLPPSVPQGFSIIPPTIMAIDSPTKTSISLHSPRHGFFGTKFGFDAIPPYSSAWNDITTMGANRMTMKYDIPANSKNTKVTQFATEIPPLPQGPIEYLRMDFISATTSFFYHMERESRPYSDISLSFQKFRFTMDCDHMALTLLRVIYAKFYHSFKTCNDSVIVLQKAAGSDGSMRLQTIRDSETLMATALTQDKGHVIDFSEDYSDIDYAILVYNQRHMDEMIHQSMEAESPPATDLESLSKMPQDSHFQFGPTLEPCFVPRRRLFFLTIRGEALSLFLYNVNPETTAKIKEIVERALHWNNARARLLREIGLHKMQITHLSTLKPHDPKVYFYQLLTWREPELLVTHDYPPENIKTADFAKLPKKFARMFLKIYRFTDPSYVFKQNTTAKFDDQIAQMLSIREELKEVLSDFQLFGQYHSLFQNPTPHSKHKTLEDVKVSMDEEDLIRLLSRCEEAHYVQTPLLLFPEWRKKVAAIRAIGSDFGSIGKRKHSAPAKGPVKKHSMEPKMKPRSKTVNVTMLPTLSRTSSGEEPCSLKIQFMLAQEYTNYLVKNLGAKRIFIQSTSPEIRNNYATEYTQSTTVSPIVWLYLSYAGGFILLHLSFIEPYFCLRILFWNRGQLYEDQTIQDLRSFIKEKNQIVSKCHLHSFTYDFHLRMVKTYLVGGTQLLFNRGYNTTAFLIDFLQYYACRPPSARNCIYEENCLFDQLKVPGTSVWENFLDKETKYGWKVVRLKTTNAEKESSDEFMLVSEASKKVFDQEYEGVRVITNVLKGNTSKDHKLLIRYYVIMVSKDIENPMLDALYTHHDPIPAGGEFKRLPTDLHPEPELDDEFPLDFDVAYDSDARQSSGSNSDQPQLRGKNRQSMQSIASLASGNNSNDRLSDFDPSIPAYVSPCPSPMSQTLVEASLMTPVAASANFDAIELRSKLSSQAMIQKVPPRGHRKNASISSELRILGAIPPEQVTYIHYYNNLQKKLQHELEEFARGSKVELEKLVQQADKECHIEMLWRKLLSMNSINHRKQQTSILTQIGNRLDNNQEASTLLKHITSTDLNQQQWRTFINIIKTINMENEEPKLLQIFSGVNFMKLFKFLYLHYEGEKRCRYFDLDDSKNLVITNPNCLNAATLFQYKIAEKKIELLMIIKEHEFRGQHTEFFGMNAIHKQFEEIMHCLSSFLWFDLLVRRPNPQRR